MNQINPLNSHGLNARFEESFKSRLQLESVAGQLLAAMQYACLVGGKRLRPLLAYHTAMVLDADLTRVDTCALAVELIHCYSLVHDDLPAMDDDPLRRGMPTCHVKFGEATAILVGDALQSLAYEVLAEDEMHTPSIRLDLIKRLAFASGTSGMAAGQALDLEASLKKTVSNLEHLETIHRLKTGMLIRASVQMACIASGLTSSTPAYQALSQYAKAIGLAFQVQDDILDLTGTDQALGKQAQADAALNKLTYPGLLGLKGAQEKAQMLVDEAIHALAFFGAAKAQPLVAIARYIINRDG